MSKINFCKNWKVRKLNSNEEFKMIDVPYDAMIYEERKDDVPSGKNCCWINCHDYEFVKEFTLNEEDSKKNLILEFEGVYHNATIFLNGEKIHFRPYGYTNFYVNITGKVKPNEKNELKVIAYNSDQPNSRWYSGSGIYRPVYLYIKDDKHIKINGIKIRTLDYNKKTFKINIKTSCSGKIAIDILDNNEVLHAINAETSGIFDQTLTLNQLKLWTEESPNLYKLRVRFFDDEEIITFGLRTIEYGKDGLLINGKRVILCLQLIQYAIHLNSSKGTHSILPRNNGWASPLRGSHFLWAASHEKTGRAYARPVRALHQRRPRRLLRFSFICSSESLLSELAINCLSWSSKLTGPLGWGGAA